MAERALIMTVPLSLGLCGPSSWLIDSQRPFPDAFAKVENGFVPPEICFVAHQATKHARLAIEDAATAK
jgi:hypothetical protein